MLARVQNPEKHAGDHRLTDSERFEQLQRAAERISLEHARGEITVEEMVEKLRELRQSSSNGLLRILGM